MKLRKQKKLIVTTPKKRHLHLASLAFTTQVVKNNKGKVYKRRSKHQGKEDV